jgi:Spy/CpxP family protein refolding chaperone
MKKNLIVLFLVLLTIINIAALATFAYHRFHFKRDFPRRGGPDVQPDRHMDFIKQELDLNEEQLKEFESQADRFKEETKPILDSLRTKRRALMDEIAVEEPSRDKLNMLTEEIGALQGELHKKTIVHLLEEKSILTPEQQQKFFSLLKERRDRARGFRDRGRGIGKGLGHPDFEEGE